jgi:hypothetical protein
MLCTTEEKGIVSKAWRTSLTCVVLGLSVCGCTSLGPTQMAAERFDYNGALADSWKTQALLNIVRIRYSDWPVFLDIEQIVTQYTWEVIGAAKATVKTPFGGDNDQGELGLTGKFSERPVVLYKPLKGRQYMKSMLTPPPAGAVLGLIYTGWAADQMFKVMVHSVNGYGNTQVERGAQYQPEWTFGRFISLLRTYQLRDALVIDVRRRKDTESKRDVVATTLQFLPDLVNEAERDALVEVKKLMGLDPDTNTFAVAWGAVPPDNKTLVMETRSVLQVMVELSATVDIPRKEIEEGRVARLGRRPNTNVSGIAPLMEIGSGSKAPKDAYVACEYRGRWFWIDDTSLHSKRTFTYLTLLLTLNDYDPKGGAALVITTN